MDDHHTFDDAWTTLPAGARVALERQWAGLVAGGLPCGAAILDATGAVLAVGRNHAYDPPRGVETRASDPLQHTRLAHAELNALALIPTEVDPTRLTLWTTQHPCSMCAAAVQFIGIGKVCFVADDPSDHAPPEAIVDTRGAVPYDALGDPLWWTISNMLFLYNSALHQGTDARNMRQNRERYPALVRLTLEVATHDALGQAARAGTGLPAALLPHAAAIRHAATFALRKAIS